MAFELQEDCNICLDHGGHSGLRYEDRVALIRDWLDTCLGYHADSGICRWPDAHPPLPTRVLELNLGDDTQDIRLVEGKEVVEGKGGTEKLKYAALTYRWGLDPQNPDCNNISNTVSGTLLRHKSRIEFESLDVLFQETISVLRSLDIPYLWIDRFCIIQDDQADWEREARKMADVYSNAHLTISASVSTSPTTRLLPHFWGWTQTHPYEEGSFESDTTDGTLSHRGWCIQERCLSRRIVHFGRAQLHWECPAEHHSEHWMGMRAPIIGAILGPRPFNSDRPNSRPHPIWYEVMQKYTAASFTWEKDRIFGLLRMVDVFERVAADRIIWGLWMNDLAFGLLWALEEHVPLSIEKDQQSRPEHKLRLGTLGAPSWSWLSVIGGVSWPIYATDGDWWEHRKERIIIQNLHLNETEMLIKLHGKLLPMMRTLGRPHFIQWTKYNLFLNWYADPLTTGSVSDQGRYGKKNLVEDVWILVVMAPDRGGPEERDKNGFGLLLIKGEGPGTYKRIGFVTLALSGRHHGRFDALQEGKDLSLIVLE